jgi:hypothetical protein
MLMERMWVTDDQKKGLVMETDVHFLGHSTKALEAEYSIPSNILAVHRRLL